MKETQVIIVHENIVESIVKDVVTISLLSVVFWLTENYLNVNGSIFAYVIFTFLIIQQLVGALIRKNCYTIDQARKKLNELDINPQQKESE